MISQGEPDSFYPDCREVLITETVNNHSFTIFLIFSNWKRSRGKPKAYTSFRITIVRLSHERASRTATFTVVAIVLSELSYCKQLTQHVISSSLPLIANNAISLCDRRLDNFRSVAQLSNTIFNNSTGKIDRNEDSFIKFPLAILQPQ